jgi:hypothetical protein
MAIPVISTIICAAGGACHSLADSKNFFNFEHTDSYLGWENWLTVDIARRLNHKTVVRFCKYPDPDCTDKTDLFVRSKPPICVEIKVNYIDHEEVTKWCKKKTHKLPARARNDLAKLERLGGESSRLMLVATACDSSDDAVTYKKLVAPDLAQNWSSWTAEWHSIDHFLLLAMSQKHGG